MTKEGTTPPRTQRLSGRARECHVVAISVVAILAATALLLRPYTYILLNPVAYAEIVFWDRIMGEGNFIWVGLEAVPHTLKASCFAVFGQIRDLRAELLVLRL
jgi:hypothetical protein